MVITLPYRLNKSSTSEEIATNIAAIIDGIHHGVDSANFAKVQGIYLDSFVTRRSLAPIVSCLTLGTGVAPNEFIVGLANTDGGAAVFATSVFCTVGGRNIEFIANATLAHDYSTTASEAFTEFATTSTAATVGQDGVEFSAANTLVIRDTTVGVTTYTICVIAWCAVRG